MEVERGVSIRVLYPDLAQYAPLEPSVQDMLEKSHSLTVLLLTHCRDLLLEYRRWQGPPFLDQSFSPPPFACPGCPPLLPAELRRSPLSAPERLRESHAAHRVLAARLLRVQRWQGELNPRALRLHRLLGEVGSRLGLLASNLAGALGLPDSPGLPEEEEEEEEEEEYARKLAGLSVCQAVLSWLEETERDLRSLASPPAPQP
ncbi:cardiotrophin-1-like isoform X2 [Lepisosteus oculatus]|uniref:cardiotrophin-1-like isoform X2 n=1 Tax=Lepisosteus oculatus TaxID=7918 RepID=UPI0037224DE5